MAPRIVNWEREAFSSSSDIVYTLRMDILEAGL